jgi:uncharacterized protein YjbI with pentapeptide repeats
MTESEIVNLLSAGKNVWNSWKDGNPSTRVSFSDLSLDGMSFEDYHLDNCYFNNTSLKGCNFNNAWLAWCNFFHCDLSDSTFTNPAIADLQFDDKRLMGVNLRWTNFAVCNLDRVDMNYATLEGTRFFQCSLNGANLSNSMINGLSAWDNTYDDRIIQDNLYVSAMDDLLLTVDNFEIAQFIHMLTNNKNIRTAVDTLATKIVLILGSFANGDKLFLDAFKSALKKEDLVPIMYDFDKPKSRNHTETVSTIAHLSKFIIADLTNQRSIPHELASIIPHLRSVVVIPIVRDEYPPFGMFEDYQSLNHVGNIIKYSSDEAISKITNKILIESDHVRRQILSPKAIS